MSRSADTRRIRRRAALWRSWHVSPDEAERQLAKACTLLRKDKQAIIAAAQEYNTAGLRRALTRRHREGHPLSRSASYWRQQIIRWLAALRSVKRVLKS